jgi:outer membrane protein OmpA-like peptidoglycan-associated protein
MARKRGRGVADVSRYTGSSSRPPSFGDTPDDDSIASGTSFFLISLVIFLAISFGAINFGTKNIEANIEGRATQSLEAAGFTDVEVEADGATVHLSGSITTEQVDTTAFDAVNNLTGVRSVDGTLWPVFAGELDEIVVTGDAIVVNWDEDSITVEGTVAAEERSAFIADTLSADFSTVDTDGVIILEGLEDDSGWLGTTLGLIISLKSTLPVGKMIVDPNGKLLVVGGEVEGKQVRNDLNARVIEVGEQLGFDVNPAIRVLVVGPTEEEIEELQVDLDALIEGKVVEFETKSFELTPTGIGLLDEILVAIRKAPDVRLSIAGPPDSKGSSEENQRLSEDRAQAVLSYLVTAGESPSRIEIIGYGEDQPTDTNDTKAGRARNRRIVFIALEGT